MSENLSTSVKSLFSVRSFAVEDAAALYQIIRLPAVCSQLIQVPTMELSEIEEWAQTQSNGRYRIILEANGQVAGYGSLRHNQRPRMRHTGSMGLYIHPDYWGSGGGTLMMEAMLDLADNWLNLNRVELDVYTTNHRAIRLYEQMGFEIEGTVRCKTFGNGQWQDAHLMARLRHLPKQEPAQGWVRKTLTLPKPEHIEIRPFNAKDIPDFQAMLTHPGVARTTLQLPFTEVQSYVNRFANYSKNGHRLVADVNGRVVGNISVFKNDNPRMAHSAGLGMSVHPDYWGMGIGTLLMERILDIADNWLNLKRVELDVFVDNPAAIRLYQKFGFEIEGTKRLHAYGDGRWTDSYFMGRVRE
jgi:putative acetyltransferase